MWIMLLSTIRYSMGRRTYMTSLAPELVGRYKKALTDDQLKQIKEEVEKEIKMTESMGKTLGDECDHISWTAFVNQLEEILTEIKKGK